jgi:flagellar basal body rod protein FlgG
MAHGIYSAVSGAVAQTRVLDTVANNLANVSTPGFKGERVSFAEVLSQAAARGGRPGVTNSFVKIAEARMDLRPGMLRPTEHPLDVALEGKGFLCLQDGNREVYSRGGTLHIRADGVLSDSMGKALLGRNNKPLRPGLEAGNLTIDAEGSVRTKDGVVGTLKIVEFAQPAVLQRQGGNVVAAPPEAGVELAKETKVRQGHLEAANVNPVSEVSSMILASRAYESMHSLISTFREIEARTVNELGRE